MTENFIPILLIALSLCFDTFSISTVKGVTTKKLSFLELFKVPFFFSLSQGSFFVMGKFISASFINFIGSYDHWLAFILLLVVGIKMIYEAVKGDGEEKREKFPLKVIVILSIATSIDAFAVGLASTVFEKAILFPFIVISIVTFLISIAGIITGYLLRHPAGNKAEIIGGIVLIGLGFKILIQALFF